MEFAHNVHPAAQGIIATIVMEQTQDIVKCVTLIAVIVNTILRAWEPQTLNAQTVTRIAVKDHSEKVVEESSQANAQNVLLAQLDNSFLDVQDWKPESAKIAMNAGKAITTQDVGLMIMERAKSAHLVKAVTVSTTIGPDALGLVLDNVSKVENATAKMEMSTPMQIVHIMVSIIAKAVMPVLKWKERNVFQTYVIVKMETVPLVKTVSMKVVLRNVSPATLVITSIPVDSVMKMTVGVSMGRAQKMQIAQTKSQV